MGTKRYRWTPGGPLELLAEGGPAVLVQRPATGDDEALLRAAAARLVLVEAESERLVKPRPPRLADALARAFADEVLGPAEGPLELTAGEVVAWIDGPGLDVILAVCLEPAPDRPAAGGSRGPRGRVKRG